MGSKISLTGADGSIIATEEVADNGIVTFTVPPDSDPYTFHLVEDDSAYCPGRVTA